MAEIHVAPRKKSRVGLWIVLILLLIAAAIAWYVIGQPTVAQHNAKTPQDSAAAAAMSQHRTPDVEAEN